MTVEYCTAEDVTNYYRGGRLEVLADVSLQADSGASETNKDRVYLTAANAAKFYPGERVTVYDDDDLIGEEGTISSITFNGNSSYLDLSADMTGQYTTASSAKVKLRGFFNRETVPDIQAVHRMINDAEDEIDARTHDSWRSTTVTDEYHDRPFEQADWWVGTAIRLYNRGITTFVSGTDKVEVYSGGGNWEDWVANRTEGRGANYWVDYTNGIVYLKGWWFMHAKSAVRVTYRYGQSTVPNDIRKCCAKIVTKELLMSDQHVGNVKAPEGAPSSMGISGRVRQLEDDIQRIISRHRRMILFHR
jgi:hypothetical protein